MLNKLFAPAMAIMSRLRFALKLGLVGLLFLAPLVVLVVYLYATLDTEIRSTETERLGAQQVMSARMVVRGLVDHRGASYLAQSGDQTAKQKLAAVASEVDDRFKDLSALDSTIGATLKTRNAFANISKDWIGLRSNALQMSIDENYNAHNKLVDEVFGYIKETADKSNMTLDTDIDSFYVMNPAVFKLPTLLASVGRLRNLGTRILQQQAMSPDEKTEMTVQQRFFLKDFGGLNSDYAKAIETNSALAATVGSKVKEAGDAAKSFLDNEVASLAKGDFSLPKEVYRQRASIASDALYSLFDVSMQQFDNLLVARLNRLETNLYLVFGGTGVALLLVLYLFVGMLLSVLRSLKSIEQGAERLAQGDVSKPVDSYSSDELRNVGSAVNSVAQILQKFTKAQIAMARAHNDDGRIGEEMRPRDFDGAYGDMARNLNAMVKGHIEVQTRFTELMSEYAGGKFDSRMPPLPGERKAISDAAEKVRAELEANAKAAQFNARVKAALDHVSIPVRIADNDGVILYVNRAMDGTLRKYETNFRRQIPGFDPNKVVGDNICMFLGDAGSAGAYLNDITRATQSRMVLGGRDFDIVTTPVIGEHGERLGTAAQWAEITEQLAAEKEVATIVEAAATGDFSKRIAEADKSGFMLQMAQGLNAVLGTSEQALGEIGRILKALAQGDLSQEIRADFKGVFGELKDNSNETIAKLRDIIAQIREASQSINTAAREIATGNNDLSRRTEEQASSLEETASSMEEFASTVKLNAENAQEANRLAAEASESAQRGGDVVARVVSTMTGITESNREIVDITTLIDGIAFQTNLLALNAAVEAARAGEQGRGFAVVASEVRNLAQRAAEAAKNIKSVVSNSVGKVDEGAKLVQSAGAAMGQIVAQVRRVTDIVGEIAAASKEQSGGIEQVNQAITQIDQITQQNAALVEEATAAAKSLEDQSDALVGAVAVFKIADERSRRGPSRTQSEERASVGLQKEKVLH